MLPLRHLFDNRPLAELLRANWDADAEPFPWFRISANAVYPFSHAGERRFLRFAPQGEKALDQLQAELDFLNYLRASGYRANVPVPARDGRLIVEQSTPWGSYVAIVLEGVPGVPLGRTELSEVSVAAYGRALGELHRLSAGYHPPGPRRRSEVEMLAVMRTVLAGDAAALAEADLIEARLRALPRDTASYGLVHYDFECDNVLFDAASGECWAVDFDDATYHWYAMDIEQALASLEEEAPGKSLLFLDGYALVRPLPPDLAALRPICARYADLFWYTRVRRSLAETLPDEPEWMTGLRAALTAGATERATRFGTPL
jgi:Ser/Thr protein kinase RdoA (MazF antagonist)